MSKETNEQVVSTEDINKALDDLEAAAADSSDNSDEVKASEEEVSEKIDKAERPEPEAPAENTDDSDTEVALDEENLTKASAEAAAPVSDELYQDDVVQKAIEVSDFMGSVVSYIGDATDSLQNSVEKSRISSQEINKGLIKALRSQNEVIQSLEAKIEEYGGEPARPQKAVTVDNPSEAVEKAFLGKDADSALTPKEILKGLTTRMEKGEVDPLAVIAYEGNGYIDPSLLESLESESAKA